jgi:hypothetical protein
MLNFGLHTEQDNILFCNRSDVCEMCAQDLSKEEGISVPEAKDKLAGKLEGEKAFLVPINGQRIVLCKKHIKRVNDDLQV